MPDSKDDKADAHFILGATVAGRDCRARVNEIVSYVLRDCQATPPK